MNIMNQNLSEIFSHTMDVSLQASVMILLIMIIKRVLGKRLPCSAISVHGFFCPGA